MNPKQMLAAGAIAGSVALGAGAGALLFTPTVSIAQDGTTTTTTADNDGGRLGHPGLGRGPALDVAAEAIGISVDDLRTELEGGKTIAEVAKAHDVDPQKVIDAVVAAATKRIDEAVASGDLTEARAADLKADLVDHATRLVNETPPPGGRGPGGFRGEDRADDGADADPAVYAVS